MRTSQSHFERGLTLLETVLAMSLMTIALLGLHEIYAERNRTRMEHTESMRLRAFLRTIEMRAAASEALYNQAPGDSVLYDRAALVSGGFLGEKDQAHFRLRNMRTEAWVYMTRLSGSRFSYDVALAPKDPPPTSWGGDKHRRSLMRFMARVGRAGYFRARFSSSREDFLAAHFPHGDPFGIDDHLKAQGVAGAMWKSLAREKSILVISEPRSHNFVPAAGAAISGALRMTGSGETARISAYLTGRDDWMHPLKTPLTYNLARALLNGWVFEDATPSDLLTEVEARACESASRYPVPLAAAKHLYAELEDAERDAPHIASGAESASIPILKARRHFPDHIFESETGRGLSSEEKDLLRNEMVAPFHDVAALAGVESSWRFRYERSAEGVARDYGAHGSHETHGDGALYRWRSHSISLSAPPLTAGGDFVMSPLVKHDGVEKAGADSWESLAGLSGEVSKFHAGLEAGADASSLAGKRSVPRPSHALPVSLNLYQRILSCDHRGRCAELDGARAHEIGALDAAEAKASSGGAFNVGHIHILYPDALLRKLSLCAPQARAGGGSE